MQFRENRAAFNRTVCDQRGSFSNPGAEQVIRIAQCSKSREGVVLWPKARQVRSAESLSHAALGGLGYAQRGLACRSALEDVADRVDKSRVLLEPLRKGRPESPCGLLMTKRWAARAGWRMPPEQASSAWRRTSAGSTDRGPVVGVGCSALWVS